MMLGKCSACQAKDETIQMLREMIRDRDRTLLALVDKRALAMMKERTPRATSPKTLKEDELGEMHVSAAGVRQTIYEPPITREEVERQFAAGDGVDLSAMVPPDSESTESH